MVRCSPGEDGTNGFFVSMFVRSKEAEEQSVDGSSSQKRKAPDHSDNPNHGPAKRKRKKKKSKPADE